MLQPKNYILERQTKKEVPEILSVLYKKISEGIVNISQSLSDDNKAFFTPLILKRYLQQDNIDLIPPSTPEGIPNSFSSKDTVKFNAKIALNTENKGMQDWVNMTKEKGVRNRMKIESFGEILARYGDLLLQIRELHFRIHQFQSSDTSGLIDNLEKGGEQNFDMTEAVADIKLLNTDSSHDTINNESVGDTQEQIKHTGMLIKGYAQTIAGICNGDKTWTELDKDYQWEMVDFVSKKYLSLLQDEAIGQQLEKTWNSIPSSLDIIDTDGDTNKITRMELFKKWSEEFSSKDQPEN